MYNAIKFIFLVENKKEKLFGWEKITRLVNMGRFLSVVLTYFSVALEHTALLKF